MPSLATAVAAPTFQARMAGHLAVEPGAAALVACGPDGEDAERLTRAVLAARVDELARGLVAAGLAGHPVALLMDAGAGFVLALLACLRAGAIAVPMPHPRGARHVERCRRLLEDARPAAVLGQDGDRPALDGLGAMRWLTLDSLAALARGGCLPDIDPAAPAFIQYSSGSTRAPRGIVVSHANLAANVAMIQQAGGLQRGWATVGWLPPFHDMGLVGTILVPLATGGTSVLMSPQTFLLQPLRWLQAIHRHRACSTVAPSFGFELCLRRADPARVAALDLSTLRAVFCGAERVRATVLERFARQFAPAGFRRDAFLPCYGLAEATLMVSCVRPGDGVRGLEDGETVLRPLATPTPLARVACGPVVAGGELMLRPVDAPAAAGAGEICVAGPHVAAGTWSGARQCVEPFEHAFRDAAGTVYVPTGDLGMVVQGELVPLDRIKDLIIAHGTKLSAADIEAAVLEGGDMRLRAAAAFAVDNGRGEELVVLCEVERDGSGTLPDRQPIQDRVGASHGIAARVHYVRTGVLPRTSSGKIQRQQCRHRYLAGEFRID